MVGLKSEYLKRLVRAFSTKSIIFRHFAQQKICLNVKLINARFVLTYSNDDITLQKAINNIEKLGGKINFTPNGVTVTVPEEHRRT